METEDLVDDLITGVPTENDLQQAFRSALDALGVTQSRLAVQMMRLGDPRKHSTILRSIQRMANGEARVSGEMLALVEMMQRDRRRAERLAKDAVWTKTANGGLRTHLQGFRLSVSPESRGRWSIYATHEATNYSPAIPHWRSSLEEAKLRAVLCIDEGLDQLEEIAIERGETEKERSASERRSS